jgi:hypothetical protein
MKFSLPPCYTRALEKIVPGNYLNIDRLEMVEKFRFTIEK